MFEPTKKRQTADEVKERVPATVISLLWQTVSDFRTKKKIVSSPLAMAFSDDHDAEHIYVLVMQENGDVAEEVTLNYNGSTDFLGQGTIVIVTDKNKTINMALSKLNKD
ncbi:hypothetical protein [Loigolactobacillus jiayinensis]|uniref:DUF960 domain-containing protein n=1 Tax=Loigolactobacillus jiayinensis TaxID=2486016 RepID=A0ABW1RFW8_9LACO|nr:hypothetical protein [Loigolactobacillus jiayinensis]